MTTSSSFGLSPEAKEFVPLIQIATTQFIPPYVIPSAYSPGQQQQPLMYQLMKIPEVEFHVQPTQQFHIDNQLQTSTNNNQSQVIIFPTNNSYPNPQLVYSSNYYPFKHNNQTSMNHSYKESKSNRSNNRNSQQNYSKELTNKHKNPINKNNDRSFQFRPEDFPTLPIDEKRTPSQTSTNMNTTISWNAVVATPHVRSVSQSSNKSQISIKNEKESSKEQNIETKPKQKKKNSKKQKNKQKEESLTKSESVSFTLDDENAFPTLEQAIAKKFENNSTTTKKENVSTPGLINKSKINPKQTYQICLTDMVNALSISTQANIQNKTNKSSILTVNSANPLDSNPVLKRGKEREQPKQRKPTKLKRIINKELDELQKQRQQLISKTTTIKQNDDEICHTNDCTNDPSINTFPVNIQEYTSASCTEESHDDESDESDDDDDDDGDDDPMHDHEPTSQLQTPYAQQIPQSNIKQQIHDSAFREYCSQLIDRQLDELCVQLLITLKRFQDRKKQQFQTNPERARRKRRFVHGIREVTKHLRLQRLKCVLIAPDCQSIQSQGGLNDVIDQIINLCKEQNIPYVFTLNRQKLGRCLNKISRISTIGIFDYSGADQIYKQIIEITNENQSAYKQIIDNTLNNDETKATPSHGLNTREFYKILHRTFHNQPHRQQFVNTIPNESLSKVLPKVPAHYAHSRQTSDTSTIYIDPQLINSIKRQHARASSGTFDVGKTTTKKNHQRTLSDGAANPTDTSIQLKHHVNVKTHSRTPSGCSAISQIELHDYFEQSKTILMNDDNDNNINNHNETLTDNDENRLKSINEDTEENSANMKRKHVEKWINDN